jgi:hypothetical protein
MRRQLGALRTNRPAAPATGHSPLQRARPPTCFGHIDRGGRASAVFRSWGPSLSNGSTSALGERPRIAGSGGAVCGTLVALAESLSEKFTPPGQESVSPAGLGYVSAPTNNSILVVRRSQTVNARNAKTGEIFRNRRRWSVRKRLGDYPKAV